jgi:Lipoprotein LpqB beta-propeller domain
MKRAAGVLAVLALVVAGCTGVPASSAPQTVEAVDTGAGTGGPTVPPDLSGLGARDVVDGFIHASATASANPNLARAFLTPRAAAQWPGSDPAATIIANDYTVGTEDLRNHTVTVSGRVLGTLTGDGIYTPSLHAAGQGGERQPFVFDIGRVGSGYRIAQLHAGLVLTDDDFRKTYRQQAVYFYDLTGKTLVPDLRWTALVDKTDLAKWLLAQIVNGPRPEMQSAVTADTMPADSDPGQIGVSLGSPTTIDIPGSSQLPPGTRDRLAAQLSQTLLETLAGRDMSIADSGRPVTIPSVNGNVFAASDFTSAIGPAPLPSEVYYLQDGRVRDDSGRLLAGVDGGVSFSSVALGRAKPDTPLLVAGVTGTGARARLEVGTAQRGGLHPVALQGPLTRPAFEPGTSEVWVGSGSRLYLVSAGAASGARPVRVPVVGGGGQIVALRLSPEGARIAIVIAGGDGRNQLWVGSVVRGGGPPRIDKLVPISPDGVDVTDVAWLDPLKLFAIGSLAGSQDPRTFETGVDGTDWTNARVGLPSAPDAVAAATGSSVWVSAGGFVWKQSGTAWLSPGPTGQTLGTAPVYLE